MENLIHKMMALVVLFLSICCCRICNEYSFMLVVLPICAVYLFSSEERMC